MVKSLANGNFSGGGGGGGEWFETSKLKGMLHQALKVKKLDNFSNFKSVVRGGGGGDFHIILYTGRAVFQGIIFQHKFLNRV